MLVSDTVLEIKVRRALQASDELNESNISVHAQEGVITLAGTVPSEGAKHTAAELAENVFGVDEVDNRLRIAG